MPARSARTGAQKVALVSGVIIAVLGALGSVPGLFPYDPAVIRHVAAVYLLFGSAGLIAGRSHHWSRRYLRAGVAVYSALLVHGLLLNPDPAAGPGPNNLGTGLHLTLAVGMLIATIRTRPGRTSPARRPESIDPRWPESW